MPVNDSRRRIAAVLARSAGPAGQCRGRSANTSGGVTGITELVALIAIAIGVCSVVCFAFQLADHPQLNLFTFGQLPDAPAGQLCFASQPVLKWSVTTAAARLSRRSDYFGRGREYTGRPVGICARMPLDFCGDVINVLLLDGSQRLVWSRQRTFMAIRGVVDRDHFVMDGSVCQMLSGFDHVPGPGTAKLVFSVIRIGRGWI